MGYIAPPSELTLSDPSGEPIFEVIATNTINDGRRAVGTVVLDPETAQPVGPSTPQVVSDVADEATSGRVAVADIAVQVLPADPARTCCTLRNLGPDDADLSPDPNFMVGTGFPLRTNEAFDIRAHVAIYALSTGNSVIGYWLERS